MASRSSLVPVLATAIVAVLALNHAAETSPRAMSFDDRVNAQIAIERVYLGHRSDSTRTLETAATREAVAAKVRKYLAQSLALEHYWKKPVTAEMLEGEVERMVLQSRTPRRLAELFDALGNDPIRIQECLARQTLVSRLVSSYFNSDERIHSDTRRIAEQLHADLLDGTVDPQTAHRFRTVMPAFREEPPTSPAPLSEEIGVLREEKHSFVIDVPLGPDRETASVVRYRIPKQSLDLWLQAFMGRHDEHDVPSVSTANLASARSLLRAATTADPTGCSTGEWRPLIPMTPVARAGAATVWTGSEMIVWGGGPSYDPTGERYDPVTDMWTATSTANAPAGRRGATAVWTGSEMIVWGGYSTDSDEQVYLAGGGRYDPLTDTWTLISIAGAPEPREEHTAIWTGSEMIVWGGGVFSYNHFMTGGRYTPATDSWTPLNTTDAPAARSRHTAVWTGTEMIVWGGVDREGTDSYFNTGGRYDPATDSWTPTTTASAPDPRYKHAAIWTGDRMIVWGGYAPVQWRKSGALYDPVTDSWSPTMLLTAPNNREPSAIWTGSEMIVWGGWEYDDGHEVPIQGGSRYNPASYQWQPVSLANAPPPRRDHSAVWTGTEMIVWGGSGGSNTGGRYDPVMDSWLPMAATSNNAPVSDVRDYETEESVWTGNELIVWVGNGDGGRYDPATAAWTAISGDNQPSLRKGQNAIWSGDEMIVWGTYVGLATGARYDPLADSWAAMSTVNAPECGYTPSAVWTGSEMLVWSSYSWDVSNGGRYAPSTDSWTPISTVDSPWSATGQSAVWTGTEMIVWGGWSNMLAGLSPGGRYSPMTDSWLPVSTTGAPAGRLRHQAVWTGDEMIVWGGMQMTNPLNDPEHQSSGGRYDPVTDSWTMTSTLDAPNTRSKFTAVWTGNEMIVWGGLGVWYHGNTPYDHWNLRSGGHYDPQSDTWWPTSMISSPSPRWTHSAFWTGDEMLVWGGDGHSDGGFYGASTDLDEDGYCSPADCDESDPSIHNDAPEINDGIDNQCPGDLGYGAVDEISDGLTCTGDGWISWTPQSGATLYRIARSDSADFSTDCMTETSTGTSYDTSSHPTPGGCWYYLVRAEAPNAGSWGLRSDGNERVVGCE